MTTKKLEIQYLDNGDIIIPEVLKYNAKSNNIAFNGYVMYHNIYEATAYSTSSSAVNNKIDKKEEPKFKYSLNLAIRADAEVITALSDITRKVLSASKDFKTKQDISEFVDLSLLDPRPSYVLTSAKEIKKHQNILDELESKLSEAKAKNAAPESIDAVVEKILKKENIIKYLESYKNLEHLGSEYLIIRATSNLKDKDNNVRPTARPTFAILGDNNIRTIVPFEIFKKVYPSGIPMCRITLTSSFGAYKILNPAGSDSFCKLYLNDITLLDDSTIAVKNTYERVIDNSGLYTSNSQYKNKLSESILNGSLEVVNDSAVNPVSTATNIMQGTSVNTLNESDLDEEIPF